MVISRTRRAGLSVLDFQQDDSRSSSAWADSLIRTPTIFESMKKVSERSTTTSFRRASAPRDRRGHVGLAGEIVSPRRPDDLSRWARARET